MFSGQRMMTSYIRPGGVLWNRRAAGRGQWGQSSPPFPSKVDEYENLLDSNPIWKIRTQGVGFISIEDMLDLGVTGPMLRAAGILWTSARPSRIRATRSLIHGSDAHRKRCVCAIPRALGKRCARARAFIVQAMEGMPEGPFQADAPHVVLPDREKMKTQMEALIYHFKIRDEGFRVPAARPYQAVESPRGEIAYYIVSDGTSKPYRLHMRTPSFANLMALPQLLEGTLIADSIRFTRQHGFVLEIRPLMNFSPQLEERFAKMLTHYPGKDARAPPWCPC